jgi:hypothetical protein
MTGTAPSNAIETALPICWASQDEFKLSIAPATPGIVALPTSQRGTSYRRRRRNVHHARKTGRLARIVANRPDG